MLLSAFCSKIFVSFIAGSTSLYIEALLVQRVLRGSGYAAFVITTIDHPDATDLTVVWGVDGQGRLVAITSVHLVGRHIYLTEQYG
jgi:hypothetical protein